MDIKIIAINKSTGRREEVTDLYWFEEEFVNSFNDPSNKYDFEIYVDNKIVFYTMKGVSKQLTSDVYFPDKNIKTHSDIVKKLINVFKKVKFKGVNISRDLVSIKPVNGKGMVENSSNKQAGRIVIDVEWEK